jgi:1-acyl-sn-glycerol-3-phosphate acyltransferase
MRQLLSNLRGVLVALLLFAALIFIALSILIGAAFVWVVPMKAWRHRGTRLLLLLPTWWMDINKCILSLNLHGKWDIQGEGPLKPKGWYILISNHQTWIDILVLGIAFKHKLPVLKFFMKKQLLWGLPLGGLACQALGYPFMERHTREDIRKNPALKGKDIETTKKACLKFKEHPTTVMNFVEGTRFNKIKHSKQRSPFKHLLKPSGTGTAVVLSELHDKLDGIVNATIHYNPKEISLWQFACGRLDKITVQFEVLPITPDLVGDAYNDREFRRHFQTWLNDLWQRKDDQLNELS